MLREHADQQVAAGYTNIEEAGRPAGKWWICEQCFGDFREEFRWTVADSDPDAWPYHRPEPGQRPTAGEYDQSRMVERPDGRWLKRPE